MDAYNDAFECESELLSMLSEAEELSVKKARIYSRLLTDAALADARYFVSQLLPSLAAPFEQRLGAVVAPSQGELAAGRIEAYLAQMDGYAVTVQRDLPAAE